MGPDLDINGFHIFLTIFLVLLNGFFVAAEFAIVRVRGSQIEIQAKAGSRMAKVARGIMHNLDGYLAATQLGITIASLGLGWAGEGSKCPRTSLSDDSGRRAPSGRTSVTGRLRPP